MTVKVLAVRPYADSPEGQRRGVVQALVDGQLVQHARSTRVGWECRVPGCEDVEAGQCSHVAAVVDVLDESVLRDWWGPR